MSDLLSYYDSELRFLRRIGEDFADRYPKVASRLHLGEEESRDPHVERLIESSAFVAAHIRKKLDDQFPEIVQGMWEILHPDFLAPTPSMAIAQFDRTKSASKPTKVITLPRGLELDTLTPDSVESAGGASCRFCTCYDVEIWPLDLELVRLTGPPFGLKGKVDEQAVSVLQLTLRWDKKPVETLDRLRFHLAGDFTEMTELHELLFTGQAGLVVGPDASVQRSRDLQLSLVGFAPSHSLLPRSSRNAFCFQLLTEYFAFPQKFLFFEISGLRDALQSADSSKSFQISILLNQRNKTLERTVTRDNVLLNCTPVINLFPQQARPIRVTHEEFEYPVTPDVQKPSNIEPHSITRVSEVEPDGSVVEYAPMYSFKHAVVDQPGGANLPLYWCARKTRRWNDQLKSEQFSIFLSLVNASFQPHVRGGGNSVVGVETMCTNGDTPSRLPFGRKLLSMQPQSGPFDRCNFVTRPTPIRRPPLTREWLWRLTSGLSLNHLSVPFAPQDAPTPIGDERQVVSELTHREEQAGVEAFRELLKLYDSDYENDRHFPYDAILRIESRRTSRRVAERRVRGRVEPAVRRGLEITVLVDPERFSGFGLYLFACVMEHFFSLYSSINSFTQLTVRFHNLESCWKWPPRIGQQIR